MGQRIKTRRDTGANWTTTNPVLLDGEIGYDKTAKKAKIGDGVATWTALPYLTTLDYNDLSNKPAATDLSTYATTASVNTALAAYTQTANLDATYATDADVASLLVPKQTAAQVAASIAAATIDGGSAAG